MIGCGDWFGVQLVFYLLWSQRVVSQAVHTMRIVAETAHLVWHWLFNSLFGRSH